MRKGIPWVFFTALIIILRGGGFTAALPFVAIAAPIAIALYWWTGRQAKLREAGQRIDDRWVVAIPPAESDIEIPGLEEYYWTVQHGQVAARYNKETKLLTQAGNRTGCQIHRIYYNDGEHVGESTEEYIDRCRQIIRSSLQERHQELKEKAEVWYNIHHHHDGYTMTEAKD